MPWTYTFHRQAMLNKTTRILKPIAFRTRFHGEAIKMLWLKRGCYDLKRSQRFHAKTSPLQWLKTKCYDLTLPLVESAGHLSGPKKKCTETKKVAIRCGQCINLPGKNLHLAVCKVESMAMAQTVTGVSSNIYTLWTQGPVSNMLRWFFSTYMRSCPKKIQKK